jgi:hypothetical protein
MRPDWKDAGFDNFIDSPYIEKEDWMQESKTSPLEVAIGLSYFFIGQQLLPTA